MRVLLIYANRARDLVPAPPIGLAYVATATRDAGHDVRFIDLLPSADPDGDLRRALAEFRPEAIGISVRNIDNVVHQRLTRHLGELARLIALLRAHSPAWIVVGGPAISILGASALKHLDADIAVIGEGERSFPALLAALESGADLGGVDGISYRAGGIIRSNPPARLAAFGASGMEQWIDWHAYERLGGTWALQTKRGCPLACSYCAYPAIEGEGLRRRPAAEVVDEIERVAAEVGPRTFEFVDSTFNVPARHALDICREIVRRRLRLRFTAMGVNPLTASAGLFALMKRAGFNSVMITPESGSDAMLRNLNKGFTMQHVRRTAKLVRAAGLRSTWFFMLGGPGETRATVEETLGFVERELTGSRFLSIFMTGIRILPGTALADQARGDGHLHPDQDLAESAFYFSDAVSEAWMLKRINAGIRRRNNIVHAAEENGSGLERLFNRALRCAGVAPPYWRFLPLFLNIPPLPTLRRRRTHKPGSERNFL
jgi:radical SAM superfamily enzyme YgiQ (UPF0313 family)